MGIVSKYVTEENIKKKNRNDAIVRNIFFGFALLSAALVVILIAFTVFKGLEPFITDNDGEGRVELFGFLTRMKWLDGGIGSTLYGIGFAIINTIIVVFMALLIAVPIAVFTALVIAKVAPKSVSIVLRNIVELLASIPSVIYGLFGSAIVTGWIASAGGFFGINTAGGLSLIATAIVLAMMITPTITILSEASIRAVDKALEQGSLALGATTTQTQMRVILPAAKSGIFAAITIGVGRALGEATAVSMVSGNSFGGITWPWMPFDTTSTLTSRMLMGIKETTGLDFDIRFSIGLVLMAIIIITNVILKKLMKRFGTLDE